MAEPDHFYLTSSYLHQRAEEARVLAETFTDQQARGQMLRLACDYDHLASCAAERESHIRAH